MTAITRIRPTFSPQFNRPQPTPQRPDPVPAAGRTLLSGPEVQRMLAAPNHRQQPDFIAYEQEYTQTLDRIHQFIGDHAHRVAPPLSHDSIDAVRKQLNGFKNHLTHPTTDFFGTHKDVIYGQGKALFHELDDLLQREAIPIQKRLNTLVTMAPALETCSGGVMTALQGAVSGLQTTGGVKGAAYRTKLQMMDALITQHVRDNHRGYRTGNEVHYVNAYFNYLAHDMGVPQRLDRFISIGESAISTDQFEECRAFVFKKLNPNALTHIMGSDYLQQIKGAQSVDVNQALAGNKLSDAFRRNQDIQQAHLNNEFGEVPQDSFLLPVPNADYSYQFVKQPTLIAKHFMASLKEENLVNYDDAITLFSSDNSGAVRMLGDLFWRDRDGACEELSAQALLAIPAREIDTSLHSQVPRSERGEVFSGIAQHILDSREQENIRSVSDAWLQDFAALYDEGALSSGQIAPVLQLAAQYECPQVLGLLLAKGVGTEIRDAQGNTLLMLAAQNGRTVTVSQLLEAGASTQAQNDAGETALMLCSQGGHTDVARDLIQQRPTDIDCKDRRGFTALMHATRNEHPAILHALIGSGADRALENQQGLSAKQIARRDGKVDALYILQAHETDTKLMACVRAGNTAALAAWVAHGENVNAQSAQGATALMLAAQRGHLDAIKLLLTAGADTTRRNVQGYTAMQLAYNAGQFEAGHQLGARPGETLLMSCLRLRHTEALRAWLQHPIDINAKNAQGKTALMLSVEDRPYDGIKLNAIHLLLGAGADPRIRDAKNLRAVEIAMNLRDHKASNLLSDMTPGADETMLMACARAGHTDALRTWLHRGEDINARNSQGMTALMWAASEDHVDAIRILRQARADLNLQDFIGRTALHHATQTRNPLCPSVPVLLEAGANPNLAMTPQYGGATPLMVAAAGSQLAAVSALLAHGADPNLQNQAGHTAVFSALHSTRPVDSLRLLLDAGANPRLTANDGGTPLEHVARSPAFLGSLVTLIEGGALPTMKARALARQANNIAGINVMDAARLPARPDQTLLMTCAMNGQADALRSCIQHGRLDVNQQDSQGMTAAMWAAASGHMNTLIALIESRKIDFTIRNQQGQTAKMLAQAQGNIAAAQLLDAAEQGLARMYMQGAN